MTTSIIQTKINNWIPEKVHNAITIAIKQMIRGVLFGAKHSASKILVNANLKEREDEVQKKINEAYCVEVWCYATGGEMT